PVDVEEAPERGRVRHHRDEDERREERVIERRGGRRLEPAGDHRRDETGDAEVHGALAAIHRSHAGVDPADLSFGPCIGDEKAAATLAASDPAVSWLGVIPSAWQTFASGEKAQYPNSMRKRPRKGLPGSFSARSCAKRPARATRMPYTARSVNQTSAKPVSSIYLLWVRDAPVTTVQDRKPGHGASF